MTNRVRPQDRIVAPGKYRRLERRFGGWEKTHAAGRAVSELVNKKREQEVTRPRGAPT